MPRFFAVFCLLLGFLLAPPAEAHGPFESSLKIETSAENFEVTALLSPDSARLLLPAEQREAFQAATFAEHRSALLAAASSVCTLSDASGAVLPPERVLVSVNRDGEVHFLFLYPVEVRPARLKVPFLEAQSLGCFCELTDATAPAPRRATLLKDRASYAFSSAPSS